MAQIALMFHVSAFIHTSKFPRTLLFFIYDTDIIKKASGHVCQWRCL